MTGSHATFGEVLRALRKGRRLTERELAHRVQLNASRIKAFENDEAIPSPNERLRLKKASGLDIAKYFHLLPKFPDAAKDHTVIATLETEAIEPEPEVTPAMLRAIDSTLPEHPNGDDGLEVSAVAETVIQSETREVLDHVLEGQLTLPDAPTSPQPAPSVKRPDSWTPPPSEPEPIKEGTPMNFGDALRQERARANLTQVELCKEIGVHELTLSRWETTGQVPVRHEHRASLAKWRPSLAKYFDEPDEIKKRCGRCQKKKLRNEFAGASKNVDGLRNYCRACEHELYVERREAAKATAKATIKTLAAKVAAKKADKTLPAPAAPAAPAAAPAPVSAAIPPGGLAELGVKLQLALAARDEAQRAMDEAAQRMLAADRDVELCMQAMQDAFVNMRYPLPPRSQADKP